MVETDSLPFFDAAGSERGPRSRRLRSLMDLPVSRSGAVLTRRIIGGIMALAALLIALEFTARFAIFGVRGLDPRRLGGWVASDVTFDTDPSIGFEMVPHIDRFAGLVRLRTNSRGMRDREYTLKKSPGTFRVAILGSSFSLAAGVEIEDAYHSLLEERLSQKFAPRRYEFLNFAVGTHMPSQFVGMLLIRALPFEPDLVIVSCTRMSLMHLLLDWDKPPPLAALDQLRSGHHSSLIELIESRLHLLPPRHGATHPLFVNSAPNARSVIKKLGEISRESGVPIVVFRIEYDPRAISRAEKTIRRRVRAEGLYYFDSRSGFEGMDPKSLWIHRLDPHPNEVAHEIFAEVLGRFLEDEGLLGS